MDSSLRSIALGLLLLATARADIQFSPQVVPYELDGVKLTQLAFADGEGKQVTYAPPAGWDYFGNAAKFVVRPRDKAQAEGIFSVRRLPEPVVFEEEMQNKLTNQALASVPNGSSDVQVVSAEKDTVLIGGKETFQVKITYAFHGQRYGRSILFLNRGKEHVLFQFTSRLEDFEELERAFHGSHFTWQHL